MTTTESIANFIHFSNNYPKDFIVQVWGADSTEIKNLFFRRSFCDFFMLLGQADKVKLVEWIELNYQPKIK